MAKKKSVSKNVSKSIASLQGEASADGLRGRWRAVCAEGDYRSRRTFDTEQDAINYGWEKHGEARQHQIQGESSQ